MRNGSGVLRITPIVLNDRYRPKAVIGEMHGKLAAVLLCEARSQMARQSALRLEFI